MLWWVYIVPSNIHFSIFRMTASSVAQRRPVGPKVIQGSHREVTVQSVAKAFVKKNPVRSDLSQKPVFDGQVHFWWYLFKIAMSG